jgi:uncharacterized protein with HEPN domain
MDDANVPICAELLDQMIVAAERIIRRGKLIATPEDFASSEAGIDAMDGIVIMLIVLGETVKKLERNGPPGFLERHPEIEWKGVKGMRDVRSHEYFGVNPAILFDVTRNKIPPLLTALRSLKSALTEAPEV